MSVLGDALQEALNANSINTYVWKGPKNPNGVQEAGHNCNQSI